MKRYFALILVFALFATVLCGCRSNNGNVSENDNGMIGSTAGTTERPKESTTATTESTQQQTESTMESSGLMGETETSDGNMGGDSSDAQETDPMGRSRRSTPKF